MLLKNSKKQLKICTFSNIVVETKIKEVLILKRFISLLCTCQRIGKIQDSRMV